MTRKLVAQLFYAVDGVVERPDKWSIFPEEDTYTLMNKIIGQQDDILLGRVSYEEWAAYWPNAKDDPFAAFINPVRKHVASTTLKEPLAWKNSRLLGPDVPTAVRKLKESSGGDIGVHGSIRLTQSLLKEGLVDELILYVMPATGGQGLRHLFDENAPAKPMKVIRSSVAKNGIALLVYAPKG